MDGLGARRHWLIWGAVIPLAAWAIVRGFGLERGYPLVPVLAFTPYAAAAALLVLGVATALRNWAAALVAGLATIALMAAVLPRAFGSGEAFPPGAHELRVLSSNVHHGTADPVALLDLVRRLRPDVMTIEELSPSFARKLRRDGVGRLLPNAILSAKRGASGGGIYSRLPMRRLPAPAPVAFRMPRAAVDVGRGHRVRLVEVHPYPPKSCCMGLWSAGLASLPAAGGSGPPWVLGGDFNATLDFSRLRELLDTGYRDAGDVTGRGLIGTWPQGQTLPPPITIDHVLADRRIAILGYDVEDVPGTDHRAVFARLAVPARFASP